MSKAVALMAESTADEVPAGDDELADVDEAGGRSSQGQVREASQEAEEIARGDFGSPVSFNDFP